jgi:hypothetical protein
MASPHEPYRHIGAHATKTDHAELHFIRPSKAVFLG